MGKIYKRDHVLCGGWYLHQSQCDAKTYWISWLPTNVYMYNPEFKGRPQGVVLCHCANAMIAIEILNELGVFSFADAQEFVRRRYAQNPMVKLNSVSTLGPSEGIARG